MAAKEGFFAKFEDRLLALEHAFERIEKRLFEHSPQGNPSMSGSASMSGSGAGGAHPVRDEFAYFLHNLMR